jgi:AraC-like DNA-binding protein
VLRYDETEVPAALADHVRCIWRLRGIPETGGAPEPIVPDGCVEIVLNLADRFIRHTDAGSHGQPLQLVAGQLTRAITIEPSGTVDLWGIRFHPWSAAAFLGLSASELREQMSSLDDASPSIASSLTPFIDAETEAGRYRALIDILLLRARVVRSPDPTLPALVAYIASARESMSVRGVARYAGLSTRRVQTMFAERVGLSPKQLMRISRFQRALQLARERPEMSWSTVALEAGYYDQAHLIHECKEIVGCTPSAPFVKEAGITESFLGG